jgi:DNA-directed RNA polymerase specialized sigma24 family protein
MKAQLDREFREFMHARWPTMVRLAYGLTGDLGYAEDVAQSAFARVYASWPPSGPPPCTSWSHRRRRPRSTTTP